MRTIGTLLCPPESATNLPLLEIVSGGTIGIETAIGDGIEAGHLETRLAEVIERIIDMRTERRGGAEALEGEATTEEVSILKARRCVFDRGKDLMQICVQMMEPEIQGTIGIALVRDLGTEIRRGIEDGAGVEVRNERRDARERGTEMETEAEILSETGQER